MKITGITTAELHDVSGRDCLIRILFLIPFIVLGCGSEISHPVPRTELSLDVKQMLSPGFDPNSVSLMRSSATKLKL